MNSNGIHVEAVGDQLSRNREIANLANVVKQAFDDIVNDYREKTQSRVTMLIYVCTCKGSRNNRDVFVRAPRIDDARARTATTTGYDPNWTRSREDRARSV